MSNILPIPTREFTKEEIDLIRNTIAPTATPPEFDLFIYRCRHMDLDPLKPGEIYFVKYKENVPGTIVVGIEGFRKRSERSGKKAGVRRGVIRNNRGVCIGAWCEVFRSDWKEPAREEVSLSEYSTGKANWQKMPETMIKKVAEAAALRMAFPDLLGGIYAEEEMDQAKAEAEREQKGERDVTNTVPDENQKRMATIEKLVREFAAIGVAKVDILRKYEIQSVDDLTDAQIAELRTFYIPIKKSQRSVASVFGSDITETSESINDFYPPDFDDPPESEGAKCG